jgi:succinyl-diaminopimelate desuccinylase
MTQSDAVIALTRQLLAFDTINPPGQEAACVRFCARALETAGFTCQVIDHLPERSSLIAVRGEAPGLCFSGHLDTVPLGHMAWNCAPFDGEITDDRLYGRGSSDMKGGVAAFIVAAQATTAPASVILTSGEETGCDGARWLTETTALPPARAMVVGESTDNQPVAGHKGALWLELTSHGVTAHGATPDLGRNAITALAPTRARLAGWQPDYAHAEMGRATCNLGTLSAGINTNSVPDHCRLTVDLRSVVGVSHEALTAELRALCGAEVSIKPIIDLPPVWTDPSERWFRDACQTVIGMTDHNALRSSVNYFTDASLLQPAMGVPVMILGPGQVDQPHVTDEYVRIPRLVEAVALYSSLIEASA